MESLRRAFRGYESAQVDQLLAELQTKIESLTLDRGQLAEEVSTLREEIQIVRASEKSVQDALVSAHRRADEVLVEARQEAETLLQVAREAGARYQDDLRGRITDLNWQIERLTMRKQRFLGSYRELLERHLAELVEPEIEAETKAPAPVAPTNGHHPIEPPIELPIEEPILETP